MVISLISKAIHSRTNETLRMPVTLETCKEGCDIPLEYCDDKGSCESVNFKLEAGEWIITFSHNVPAFKLVCYCTSTCYHCKLVISL